MSPDFCGQGLQAGGYLVIQRREFMSRVAGGFAGWRRAKLCGLGKCSTERGEPVQAKNEWVRNESQ